MHRAERKLMAPSGRSRCSGRAPHGDRAANEALDEVARLEALRSEWQPTSEISRVNQQAGIAPVPVGPR